MDFLVRRAENYFSENEHISFGGKSENIWLIRSFYLYSILWKSLFNQFDYNYNKYLLFKNIKCLC